MLLKVNSEQETDLNRKVLVIKDLQQQQHDLNANIQTLEKKTVELDKQNQELLRQKQSLEGEYSKANQNYIEQV